MIFSGIFTMLLVTALAAMRSESRKLVIGLWLLAFVAAAVFFRSHVTDPLELNF